MAAVMENVKLFNSLIRTLLFAAILGGLGFAGWTGYNRCASFGVAVRLQKHLGRFGRAKWWPVT